MDNKPQIVGRSIPRVDGVAKVTGAAKFAIDLSVPGMVFGAVVRSERAHAEIIDIDTRSAEQSPGVVRIITGRDLDNVVPYFGHIVLDHPILAIERTLYYGEPIALVIARSQQAATHAASQVEVEYRELPYVTDALEALKDDAPILHPQRGEVVRDLGFDAGEEGGSGNICSLASLDWGNVDSGFAAADLVIEGEFRYPMLYGYAMEPYNALAVSGEDGLTVYTTTQHPYMVRKDLARILSLPFAKVRVVVPYVGGGYGTKSYSKIEPLAAVAAQLTGLPVKVVLGVEESIHTTRSDSAIVRARSGYTAQGLLVARAFEIVLNSGAYTDNSPQVGQKAVNTCFGPYRTPALSVRMRSVFTNTVPASSLRGFGTPQGTFAGELQMDEAAERLGIDPVELRKRNLVGPGEEVIPGKRALEANLPEDLELLSKSVDWPDPGEGRASGLGLSASDSGAYPSSTALVRIHADGSASALVGATEMGQGSRTVLAQIAAQELALPMELVTIVSSDTGIGPFEQTTGASRTTTVVGRSLQAACQDARRQLRALAAEVHEVAVESVQDAPGGVLVDGTWRSFAEVIQGWFGAGGEVIGTGAIRRSGDFAETPVFWEIGAAGVIVSVDRDTGEVSVEKLATIGDVGFAINPAMVHGQDAGAALMGLGAALHEELVYEGEMLTNPNLVDYRVPRFEDLPREMDQMLVERQDGVGPYGSKGAGEGGGNAIGAAIASAIARLLGVRPRELPLTSERVWRLLQDGRIPREADDDLS